ncbi:O-antigen ligase family protein [uncultured Victivallis sp.]|uniref:O-antigen ligase family protein n=1 Tax=uncultured Victivallis sp. TaxID=354118 RepID=UPI0025E5686C|nr:O-antigen ligase family protein [uncultured Victivallis sp.]
MNGRRENGGWAAKWCAGYLIGLTFLLPLKFGSLAVLPEATSFYPGDLFSWLIINWPAHSFGIFSGVALFAALVVFAPGMRPLRTSGGATALLWSFGLVLVSLIGWINAATIDYAVGETIHLAGIGAYVLAVRLWLRNRPEERRWFCAALAAGACWLIYSGLSQYFVGFAETREFVEKQIAEGIPISHVMVAKINDDRVFATFVSCNVLAGYLLLLLPVTLYAVWRFAGHFEPVRLSRILLCGLVFSGLAAVLLLTRSRAAFLAALLTAGAFAMTLPKRRIYRCIPVVVLALAIVGGAIYIHRAGRGFGSMAERVDYLRSSVKMIAEKPLAGHGWGGFFYRHMELKTTGTDESAHDPHNLVMAFASQTGVIGGAVALAAVLLPLFWLGRRIFRRGGEETPEEGADGFARAVFWGECAFLLHAHMDVDLQIPASMAAAGAMLVAALPEASAQMAARGRRRWLLVAAGMLLAAVAAMGNILWLRAEMAYDRLITLARPQSAQDRLRPVSDAEVVKALREAVALRPGSPFPWEIAGDYFWSRRDGAMAEKCYREAARCTPDRPSLYRRFFDLEMARGNRAAAAKHLRRMLELFPSNPKYQALAAEFELETRK